MSSFRHGPDAASACKGEVGAQRREGVFVGESKPSDFSRTREMTKRAKCLRQDATYVEQKLWGGPRRAQINGLSVRRQHPVGQFVLDCHCPSIRLAVEIDGGQHGGSAKQASDERRTQWLASKGIVVPRFWNNDVMENFDGVLEKIASTAATMAVVASDPLPDPPPFRGRERESGV